MNKIIVFTVLLSIIFASNQTGATHINSGDNATITKTDLKDKVKGGVGPVRL